MFDLVVDGELAASVPHDRGNASSSTSRSPATSTSSPGEPTTDPLRGLAPPAQVDRGVAAAGRVVELRALRVSTTARPSSRAARRPAPVGPPRQLDQPLPRGDRSRPRPGRPIAARSAGVDLLNLGVRRAVHARPVVARTIRDLPGRPHQRQGRHQHRQRRHDARAHVRPRRCTGSSTPSATVIPTTPILWSSPDLLSAGRGPSRDRRSWAPTADFGIDRGAGRARGSTCLTLAADAATRWPRSSAPPRGRRREPALPRRSGAASGSTTRPTSPTTCIPTPAGYVRMGERFAASRRRRRTAHDLISRAAPGTRSRRRLRTRDPTASRMARLPPPHERAHARRLGHQTSYQLDTLFRGQLVACGERDGDGCEFEDDSGG